MSRYQVGFARVDITPTESVPLAGIGRSSQRMSRCVRDPLYASCFAVTDGEGRTVILMTMDLQRGLSRTVDKVRAAVTERFGIPADHIMVSGTHTHGGPDEYNYDEPSMDRYLAMLDEKLPICVALALADRKEARVFVGETETEQMNFVRQYRYTTPEGEYRYFSPNTGTEVIDETTCHASEADPTLHVVKFVREGCPDLVLVNFRAHGTLILGIDLYTVTADVMGAVRTAFEQSSSNTLLTYFNGAAGNITPSSKIPSEGKSKDIAAYGKILADYVREALSDLTEVEYRPIETRRYLLPGQINHPTAEEAAICQKVIQVWEATGDQALANAEGASIDIHSPYQAIEMLWRSKLPETMDIELNAIALGELAIVTAPNELFDAISVRVEDNAPFRKVLTFCYANGMLGYIPDLRAFETGTYEADCCKFKPGIGEQIGDAFLQMLRDIRENR